MEKKIVPILTNFRKPEIGAILVNHFGNKRKTRIVLILLGFLFLGVTSLFAEEAVKKTGALGQIGEIEKRGVVNFFTAGGEFVNAFKIEKKEHPKAWPATYVPRLFSNLAMRISSSIHDIVVYPWYAWAVNDSTPLTRHFDLPDYVWEKE